MGLGRPTDCPRRDPPCNSRPSRELRFSPEQPSGPRSYPGGKVAPRPAESFIPLALWSSRSAVAWPAAREWPVRIVVGQDKGATRRLGGPRLGPLGVSADAMQRPFRPATRTSTQKSWRSHHRRSACIWLLPGPRLKRQQGDDSHKQDEDHGEQHRQLADGIEVQWSPPGSYSH